MPENAMNLRPIRPEEARLAQNLIAAVLETCGRSLSLTDKAELTGLPASYDNAAGTFLVEERKGALLGTAGIRPQADAPGRWELNWVCVAQGWRHMGIGRLLVETALGMAREAGAREVAAVAYPRCPYGLELLKSLQFPMPEIEPGREEPVVLMRTLSATNEE